MPQTNSPRALAFASQTSALGCAGRRAGMAGGEARAGKRREGGPGDGAPDVGRAAALAGAVFMAGLASQPGSVLQPGLVVLVVPNGSDE